MKERQGSYLKGKNSHIAERKNGGAPQSEAGSAQVLLTQCLCQGMRACSSLVSHLDHI